MMMPWLVGASVTAFAAVAGYVFGYRKVEVLHEATLDAMACNPDLLASLTWGKMNNHPGLDVPVDEKEAGTIVSWDQVNEDDRAVLTRAAMSTCDVVRRLQRGACGRRATRFLGAEGDEEETE